MAAGEFKELSDAERRKAARAEGPAAVLGIGTAVPPHAYPQSDYPDFFFGVTGCEHKTELKQKFARICAKSGINKRYMYITREVLRDNPGMASYMDPSLDARQEIAVREVPKLAAEASRKAIQEWGRPKSDITHIVMGTTSGVTMPGAEVRLVKLLGLRPHTKRVMMYQQGCFAGATVVRVAKDLAENNAGARVLAVTSELTVVTFRAPSEDHLDGLVGSALFGDGAAAVVIGSDPRPDLLERPIFELAWTGETLLPDSDGAIEGKLTEAGLIFHLMRDVPGIISKNIDKFLSLAVTQTGLNHRSNSNRPVGLTAEGALSFDDMFWVVHPGGPAILDQIEKKLKLSADKLAGTRETLADYGNMSSCSVIFALDRMRHRSKELGRATTGEGCKWGFLIAFGPGLTFEVSVLKSCPI